VRAAPAPHAVARQKKADRVRRALASGAALAAVLGPEERALRDRAQAMDTADPRLEWLLSQAPRWREAREKTLVFVAHRETLEMLRTALSHRVQLATGAFHEELPPSRRDLEVARFRDPGGPSLLVSTEAGGEGRNFEFCRRLVLFDLPWKPSVVEQRIGRLDRIGRQLPVEIVYFQPPRGIGADAVRLFEALGLFREPLAGVEPELAQVEGTLEAVANDPDASLPDDACAAIVADVGAARTRVREAAFQQLHRAPYRAEMAPDILARVPADLDALNQDVVVAACTRLGFSVEHTRGRRVFAIELGSRALVDSLPGVRSGSAYVGSFDREEAVDDETIDFFASGHPLVEGVLAHFEDGLLGRVVRVELRAGRDAGEGLAAIYTDGPDFEVVALDARGRSRPDWAAALRERPRRVTRAAADPASRAMGSAMAQRLGARLDPSRRPHALALLVVKPS
jgi:ATP-dependent helicase HepA